MSSFAAADVCQLAVTARPIPHVRTFPRATSKPLRSGAMKSSFACLAIASVACGSNGPGGAADAAIDDGGTVMMISCTPNQNCSCNAGQTCDLQCPMGNCQIDCEDGAMCTIGCAGGGCQIDCKDNSRCSVNCAGGNCNVGADPGASLFVDCGGPGGCDTSCDMGTQCAQACTMSCQLDCGGSTMCTQDCGYACTCTGC